MVLTKEMVEQDQRRLIGRYNESNNPLEKRFIKIGIRHNRNLLKYFEEKGITGISMQELVYLMSTRYRYVKGKLGKIGRKILEGLE